MRHRCSTTTLALAFALCGLIAAPASGADPVLTINGVTGDNATIAPLSRLEPLQISVTGDPGAPFALLISLAADTSKPNGWFLEPFVADTVFSPIHPVFDGIGSAVIASALRLPTSDIIADSPAPVFTLGATGSFVLNGVVPPVALLSDTDPATTPTAPFGPGNPIVLPLDDPVDLFMQVVSFDPLATTLRVGNGVTLDFGSPMHPAVISYAESVGTDATLLAERQTLGTLSSPDLGGAVSPSFSVAPGFASSFVDATDVWMIQLSGPSELVQQAAPPGDDPDGSTSLGALQGAPPEPEFATGARPSRDSQNPEFPRIRLPGQRQLFHWRNRTASPPAYGFGLIHEQTGEIVNLTPPAFGIFRGTATRSPWEVQVAVSSDGNRALVVLDESTSSHDRAYLLNLEPGGVFPTGFAAAEITPAGGAEFGTAFESGATFLRDDVGGRWVAIPAAVDPSASISAFPDRLHLAAADGVDLLTDVFPGPGSAAVTRIDRTLVLNGAEDVLCFIAGASAESENVFSLTGLAADGSHAITDITGFNSSALGEATATTDGSTVATALSHDGSKFAGVRMTSSGMVPFTARTDGSGAGTISDLVVDIALGGKFDLDHFDYSTGLFLTDDGGHLLFHQGLKKNQFSDVTDQFVVDLSSGATTNLTRTISGPGYDGNLTARLSGPWAPTAPAFRPTVAYGGSFLGPGRQWRFFFRSFKEFTGSDRLDLYAISRRTPLGQIAPTFELVNVTGAEFEPFPGVVPSAGAPSIRTDAGFVQPFTPDFYRVRRFGGENVLKDFYVMTARLVGALPGEAQIDHLFLFDGANPGPAIQLTAFSPVTAPIAVAPTTRIESVTPNPADLSIAFALDLDGDQATADQELIRLDLASFGAVTRLPEGPIAYDRAITRGSIHWLGATQPGLVWSEGSVPRPDATTDGIDADPTVAVPIDATPLFLDLTDSATPLPLRTPAGTPRVAFPFAVR